MKNVTRILHLEDDPDYSVLVDMMLEKEGIPHQLTLVSNRREYEQAIKTCQFDLVLADYVLPDYDGIQAARLSRRKMPHVPFIISSGVLTEQAAISSLKAGATDFVLKALPERLVPAIRRALNARKGAGQEREREVTAAITTDFRTEAEGALDSATTVASVNAASIKQGSTGGSTNAVPLSTGGPNPQMMEAALRSTEMLFHSVWENAVNGMRLTNSQGLIVVVNEAFCSLVGLSRHQLEGRPLSVIYGEGTDPDPELREYQKQFRDRVIDRQVERQITLRSGKVITMEDTTSFVEVRGQAPLLLAWSRDVTAQKQLEEQFRHSQKMEAIGQLAGGVAHDFNNLLTVIHGHASLLQAAGKVSGACARSAQQIVEATERASRLTRQLLTFSRRQVMQPRRLDLNEVVTNMTRMLARILGEDIALRVHYFPQQALVLADAGMMEQVVMNLAVNSRDAMPRGGSLTIKISVEELAPEANLENPEAGPGKYICLAVQDTGCGIPPENLRRIFDPFFTTKEAGKGTGLGLATVYGIVKQHKGWIQVDSTPDNGATFRVFLPSFQGKSDSPQEKAEAKPARGGSETILVVEDEAAVRELVCNLLSGQGYRILSAESGSKAMEVWRTSKQKVDLLLTDLVMPDRINGRELAERLWSERPELKVLFTSGYSAEVVGKDFVRGKDLNYLQKPYHPQRLAGIVRECLDKRN